jgi:hypothetical protein
MTCRSLIRPPVWRLCRSRSARPISTSPAAIYLAMASAAAMIRSTEM